MRATALAPHVSIAERGGRRGEQQHQQPHVHDLARCGGRRRRHRHRVDVQRHRHHGRQRLHRVDERTVHHHRRQHEHLRERADHRRRKLEPNETFTVTLSGVTGATVSDGTATGTITNDDATPVASVGIARRPRARERAAPSASRSRSRTLRHRASPSPSARRTAPRSRRATTRQGPPR